MRIGRTVGEGRRGALRPIGFGALGAGATIMLTFAGLFALLGPWLAAGFTSETDVVALAAKLTVFDLLKAPWYHPTLAEIITYPLEEIADKIGQG